MLCDQILGNLYSDPSRPVTEVDWLDLTWHDCIQRALRKRTRGDLDIRILLPVGESLMDGDILLRKPTTVAVSLLPTVVYVAKPASVEQMGLIATELGNLHVPVQIVEREIVFVPDGPAEAVLRRYSVTLKREERHFVPMRASIQTLIGLTAGFEVTREKGRTDASTPERDKADLKAAGV